MPTGLLFPLCFKWEVNLPPLFWAGKGLPQGAPTPSGLGVGVAKGERGLLKAPLTLSRVWEEE